MVGHRFSLSAKECVCEGVTDEAEHYFYFYETLFSKLVSSVCSEHSPYPTSSQQLSLRQGLRAGFFFLVLLYPPNGEGGLDVSEQSSWPSVDETLFLRRTSFGFQRGRLGRASSLMRLEIPSFLYIGPIDRRFRSQSVVMIWRTRSTSSWRSLLRWLLSLVPSSLLIRDIARMKVEAQASLSTTPTAKAVLVSTAQPADEVV
ncbi:hypothetical protein CR513_35307, partial [Mucuna pruriens]